METFKVISVLDGKSYDVRAASKEEAQLKVDNPSNFDISDAPASDRKPLDPNDPLFIKEGKYSRGVEALPEGSVVEPVGNGYLYQTPSGDRGYFDDVYSTTDPEEIEKILNDAKPGELFQERIYEDVIEERPVSSRAAVALRGIPFAGEYIDEAAGKVFGPQARDSVRLSQKAMEETRPIESALLETGVGIVSTAPFGLAPTFAKGGVARIAERGAQAGTFGTVEGAVSGYGEGTTPEERAEKAQSRGVISGVISTPLGGIGGTIQNVVERSARGNIDKIISDLSEELGVSKEAATIISDMAESGGTREELERQLRIMGAEARLVNSSPAMKNLLDVAQTTGGDALRTTQEGVKTVGRELRASFDRKLDTILGRPATGPKQIFEEARAATASKRKEAYDAAYDTYIDATSREGRMIRSVLGRIPDRYMREAVEAANDLMSIEGKGIPSIVIDSAGKITEYPNIIQLDYIKRGLGKIISDETDNITGALSVKGGLASRLYGELSASIGRAVPVYKDAVELGLDTYLEESAIKLVRSFATTNLEEFTRLLSRASGRSKDQLRESMKRMLRTQIQTLEDKARATLADPDFSEEGAKGAINAFKALSSADSLKKLATFLTSGEMGQLRREMMKVSEMMNLAYATGRGSQTAYRQEGIKIVNDLIQPTFNELISGQGGGSQIVGTVIRGLTGTDPNIPVRRARKILDEVANALINTKGPNARRAVKLISDINENRSMSEEDAKFIAAIISSSIWAGTSESAQQYSRQD